MVAETDPKTFHQGLHFKDVMIRPRASDYRLNDVKTTSRVSRNVQLRRPLIGAPVPCVSNESVAIAMAMSGAVGVIHRYQSVEEQSAAIRNIKDKVSSFIRPIQTILPGASLSEAKGILDEHDLPILPVVDPRTQKIQGVIQSQVIEQNNNHNVLVADVMIAPSTSKIKSGMPERHYREVFEQQGVAFMIVVDNDDRVMGLMMGQDVLASETTPVSSKDKDGKLLVGAALGVNEDDRAKVILEAGADMIFIEALNGHNKAVLKTVTSLRRMAGSYTFDVVVGNVATKDGARALIDAGADALVVGIGSCEHSTVAQGTGVGMPSISALMEVSKQCELTNTPVIFGGVCDDMPNMSKAFAAGASGVMLGPTLAGCSETPAEVKLHNDITYKLYQSVSHYYDAGHIDYGESQYIEASGSIHELLSNINRSLKRTLCLTGCLTLKDMANEAEFIHITTN